jgi:hypothetical protein
MTSAHRPILMRMRDVSSMRAARLSPARERSLLTREIVQSHIDDLNGLHDALQLERDCKGQADGEGARARRRIDRTVAGARWLGGSAVPAIWSIVQSGFDGPEDAFAPAALLIGLGVNSRRVRRWLESLPSEVRRTLQKVGLDCPGGVQVRPAEGRPK